MKAYLLGALIGFMGGMGGLVLSMSYDKAEPNWWLLIFSTWLGATLMNRELNE